MTDEPAVVEPELIVSHAYGIEQDIVAAVRDIRLKWVDLAGLLHQAHQQKIWETLGHETLEGWLAGPDIEIGRRFFFELVDAYDVLHVKQGINVSEIGRVDVTKALVVLPAVRRGQVTADVALADAETLSRTDLRDKYRAIPPAAENGDTPIGPDDFHYEKCPTCGHATKVRDA